MFTAAERPDLWLAVQSDGRFGSLWPEYNHHGNHSRSYFGALFPQHADLQVLVLDDQVDEVVARGRTIPFRWDGTLEDLPPDEDDACLVRVARRNFEKAIKVPSDFVARANEHGAASYQAWTRARPANDFASMVPYLEKTLALSREYSDFFAPYAHVADPHIEAVVITHRDKANVNPGRLAQLEPRNDVGVVLHLRYQHRVTASERFA